MNNSFLRQTAEAILDQMEWKQLNRTTLVLPSHRAGLVLKDELLRLQQERHAQAVWAPRVRTLTQLQDDLSPLYAEDELFTIVRLYKLYLSTFHTASADRKNFQLSTDPMSLDLFYGWGRQMLADFTNIDASMPAEEVPNFFENTIAAHELEQWQLDPETESSLKALMTNGEGRKANGDSVKAQYEVLWTQLYELYKALKAQMQAEQKGYPGMRQRAVLENWNDESVQQQIQGRTFVFVGFNYLLPVERDLMLRLRDNDQALFFWDYVPNFQTNEKAFSFTKQNRDILGGKNLQSPVTRNSSPVTLIECSSRESQAQYVHRWLLENYTAKGQKVGVVICDETMLEPVIYALPAITEDGETAPVNITKGFPLRNTAIYARVLAWLNEHVRGHAEDLVSPDFIEELLQAIFPQKSEEDQSPLSWQELLALESEYQVHKIIYQMRSLVETGLGDVPFTLKLLRLLIRRTMESVTMPFHGEPVTDIQVMGVLETRLLDFDRLLILNVEEGVLPQRQNDLSFIPFYLRKTYHMQTPDERATVYAYNFFRLLNRTGQATLMYANAQSAEGGKGMSRFVMQLLYSEEFAVQQYTLQEDAKLTEISNLQSPISNVSLLSMLTKDETGVLHRADGKRYLISPSALNTFIACPRSFYFQYIRGVRPKDEKEVLFNAATMGSFVHHMMEHIYKNYLQCDNKAPVRVSPDEIEAIRTDEAKMNEALMEAYRIMNEEENLYKPEEHASENVVIKGYVSNILERDREDAKVGLQIHLLEQERLFTVPVEGVGEVLTGGRVDRLDIYGPEGDQHLRVVDYKSGSYSDTTHAKKMSATWEDLMESEDKGYVRQTLIYSEAVRQHDDTHLPIEPHLYFCKCKLTDMVTTLDLENETVHDVSAIQEKLMPALQAKVAQVLQTTDFPPCEEGKCPKFCPFFVLCGRKPKEF